MPAMDIVDGWDVTICDRSKRSQSAPVVIPIDSVSTPVLL